MSLYDIIEGYIVAKAALYHTLEGALVRRALPVARQSIQVHPVYPQPAFILCEQRHIFYIIITNTLNTICNKVHRMFCIVDSFTDIHNYCCVTTLGTCCVARIGQPHTLLTATVVMYVSVAKKAGTVYTYIKCTYQ